MAQKHFALKLLPCRPTFALDMSDEEGTIMEEHIVYWNDLMRRGVALVFGPVLDPAGPYGLGIVAVDDAAEVATITQNDPASKINQYEVHAMMAVTPEMVA